MKIKKQKLSFERLPKTYEGLMKIHLIRPVHDAVDLENATEIIELLAGFPLNDEQDEYLEALSLMVEAYESEHFPHLNPKATGIEILRWLLEEHSMNAADLARLLHVDRSLGVRILSGERRLTVDHLKALSKRFKVSPGLFIV